VPSVKKIRGLKLPETPWATSACCGRPLPLPYLFGPRSHTFKQFTIHQSSASIQLRLYCATGLLTLSERDVKRSRLLQNHADSPPILDPSTLEVECRESNQAIRRHIHEELNSEHNRCGNPYLAPCLGVAFRSSTDARTCHSFPLFVYGLGSVNCESQIFLKFAGTLKVSVKV